MSPAVRSLPRLLPCLLALLVLPARAQEGAEPALRDVAPTPQALPQSAADAVGTWDLSLDGTSRRCEIVLAGESGPDGRMLRFPAGCRRALPVLAEAVGWLYADKGVRLVDRNIYPLLVLTPSGDARSLRGHAANGQGYSLVPLQTLGMFPNPPPDAAAEAAPGAAPKGMTGAATETLPDLGLAPGAAPAPLPEMGGAGPLLDHRPAPIPDVAPSREIPGSQPVLRSDQLTRPGDRPRPQAAAQAAAPAPPTASERRDRAPEPGVYALDRFNDRDVCRIELAQRPAATRPDGAARGEGALAPARILPGCRDGGIATFDPVSWRFASGHLTLKAKRGHAVNLVATGDGRWRRDPDTGVTLVLRKVGP